jgi:multiple sugar transport system permease protein
VRRPPSACQRRRLDAAATHTLLIAATCVFAFPLLWTLATSFKPPAEYYRMPPTILPVHPTVLHYVETFVPGSVDVRHIDPQFQVEEEAGQSDPILPTIVNSVVDTGASVAIATVVSLLGAYAISRFRFRGGRDLAIWILSTRMVPPIVAVIPLFILIRDLGLLDTQVGLIIPYVMMNIPLILWILKGFIDDIPVELEEAAKIDGAGYLRVFWHVTLPLIRGGIAAAALLAVFFTWGEFLFAVSLTIHDGHTLPVALSTFQMDRGILWGPMCAAAVVTLLPLLVCALFLQRYLISGQTLGAVR